MRELLRYSPQVQLDLDEIYDYFAVEFGNPEKGTKIVDSILSATKQIPGRAMRYPRVSPLPLTNDEYRFVTVGSYLVFFRVVNATVYVDRVLHKRRDFVAFLASARREGNMA